MKIEIFERTIKTDRLLLRPWKPEDIESLAALYSDPKTIAFPPSLT